MALVLGNIALLLDPSSPRPDRKTRLTTVLDLALKRDSPAISLSTKNFDPDPDFRFLRIGRQRPSSKPDAVDFDSDNNNGFGDDGSSDGDGDEDDWENQMRQRLKEIEEMKELEKRAEELQSNMAAEEGGGKEETEEEKRNRVRKELEKLAKEQAERRETAKLMFELGQKAYGRGMYGRSIEFLEGALTIIPRPTFLGGEGFLQVFIFSATGDLLSLLEELNVKIPPYSIQIWLAMAYEASNRHRDCIALYQQLEKKHPVVSIRRQAADLRYILQAPKLKISEDEMVTIPLIGSSYDSYAGTWSDKYKDQEKSRSKTVSNQHPWGRDYLWDFLVWRPPSGWEKSRAFWVALTLWVGLVGAVLFLPGK